MIAVAFALPEESRDLVAAMRCPLRTGSPELPVVSGKLGSQEVIIFHTGMGSVSARQQLGLFWQAHGSERFECAIGAGFAGALDTSLPAGTLILAENYPQLLPRARAILEDRARVGRLATAQAVLETPQAKAECAKQTGAIAVDMETASVAAFFEEKSVPFLALRVISDTARETLPIPSVVWFDARSQRPRPWALMSFLVWHPSRLLPFVRFVQTIRRVRQTLTEALLDLLVLMKEV